MPNYRFKAHQCGNYLRSLGSILLPALLVPQEAALGE
jgi:hypothetical protein